MNECGSTAMTAGRGYHRKTDTKPLMESSCDLLHAWSTTSLRIIPSKASTMLQVYFDLHVQHSGWMTEWLLLFFPSLLKPPSSKNLQIISPAYLYKGDIYLLHNSHLQWLAIACCSWYWFLLVTSLHNSEWWCVRKTHDKTPIRLCSSSWSTWHVGAVVVHV